MLQVLQELLFNPEDKTKVTLVFANQTPADIMLKVEIDKLAAEHDNFEVIYVVSKVVHVVVVRTIGVIDICPPLTRSRACFCTNRLTRMIIQSNSDFPLNVFWCVFGGTAATPLCCVKRACDHGTPSARLIEIVLPLLL